MEMPRPTEAHAKLSPLIGDWIGEERMPRSVLQRTFAPGTEFCHTTRRVSITPLRSARPSGLVWRPSPNTQVVDQRFGARLVYHVDDDGNLLRDEEVISRLEARDLELAALLRDLGASDSFEHDPDRVGHVRLAPAADPLWGC